MMPIVKTRQTAAQMRSCTKPTPTIRYPTFSKSNSLFIANLASRCTHCFVCLVLTIKSMSLVFSCTILTEKLTFDPEVCCTTDAVLGDQISGALAGVVGVVDDPIKLATGPLVEVEVEGWRDRLEVVLGKVWRLFPFADGVPVIVVADVRPVLEPDNVAEGRALHLTLQGEVPNFGHGTGVRWQSYNKAWWSWYKITLLLLRSCVHCNVISW